MTQINSIEITDVKGIEHKEFKLNLIPNKPNLLVAPNGFGKTSIATAFDSMNSNRMNLDKKDYYQGNENNNPELKITFQNDEACETLSVNNTSNTLSKKFDVLVINSRLMPKATKTKIANFVNATASMEIEPIILRKIPAKIKIDYNFPTQKNTFGKNGKILPNLSEWFKQKNATLFLEIIKDIDLKKLEQKTCQNKISNLKKQVNSQSGNVDDIKKWISNNCVDLLKTIPNLNNLADNIRNVQDTGIDDEIDSFLATIQVINLYKTDHTTLKNACKYLTYLTDKKSYQQTIDDFSPDWSSVNLKENKKGKELSVEFPKAHHISNGERDVLTFVLLLEKAKINLKKTYCILIIDEIFDYLDNANLVAFQYYITKFIKTFKNEKRKLFPLLLTHLDPNLFNNFCFNNKKIKIHYLDKSKPNKSKDIIELMKVREEPNGIEKLERYYFHYHPDNNIDLTNEFTKHKLKKKWGNISVFKEYIFDELKKYLDDKNYDPVAVCFAVRIKIEEKVYKNIENDKDKKVFIDERGTTNKLDYATNLGIDINSIYFLLGLIYNDAIHWKMNKDIVSPIVSKLRHLTIKKLIRKVNN